MKRVVISWLVACSAGAAMASENPWKNSFSADKGGFRYEKGSLESSCSDEASYAKYLSAAMDNLIKVQSLNVGDLKSDDNIVSIDPNGDKAEFKLYNDSEYLDGAVSGSDIPDDVKNEFSDTVRRHTTLTALNYKADYKGLSFGDEFPDSVQAEVWDFCISRGEALLSDYKN
ncbi:hypothetical protein [Gilvimarinus agarilyticus]|uniref:hypothetical protein n=1 Tax=Gilvimarinus agarilyticus TaxID=679259 RepID=UPI0005A14B64|nr:hypothetical protein [Gilvimarinus agarilyticus]